MEHSAILGYTQHIPLVGYCRKSQIKVALHSTYSTTSAIRSGAALTFCYKRIVWDIREIVGEHICTYKLQSLQLTLHIVMGEIAIEINVRY